MLSVHKKIVLLKKNK